jgi:thiol-disulfide isomerase/thioredoxin
VNRATVALVATALLLSGCASDTAPVAEASPRVTPATLDVDVNASPPCPAVDRVKPRPGGLPDVELACLGAGPALRLSDLRGTPMVLNIWAAWCPNCDREMPIFGAVQERAEQRLRFFGVHYKAARDYGLRSAADFGVPFPSVHDADGDVIAGALQAFAPPQTFFVTADGRIAGRKIGEISSEQELVALIREHLGVTV